VFGGENVDCCGQLGGGETDSSIYSTDIAVILCDQLFFAELFDQADRPVGFRW